jgi:hypothetical protein
MKILEIYFFPKKKRNFWTLRKALQIFFASKRIAFQNPLKQNEENTCKNFGFCSNLFL